MNTLHRSMATAMGATYRAPKPIKPKTPKKQGAFDRFVSWAAGEKALKIQEDFIKSRSKKGIPIRQWEQPEELPRSKKGIPIRQWEQPGEQQPKGKGIPIQQWPVRGKKSIHTAHRRKVVNPTKTWDAPGKFVPETEESKQAKEKHVKEVFNKLGYEKKFGLPSKKGEYSKNKEHWDKYGLSKARTKGAKDKQPRKRQFTAEQLAERRAARWMRKQGVEMMIPLEYKTDKEYEKTLQIQEDFIKARTKGAKDKTKRKARPKWDELYADTGHVEYLPKRFRNRSVERLARRGSDVVGEKYIDTLWPPRPDLKGTASQIARSSEAKTRRAENKGFESRWAEEAAWKRVDPEMRAHMESMKKDLVTIDDLYKAQKQVRVKPYSRKGRPVIGYSATRRMAEPVGVPSGKQTPKERFKESQAADAWERAKKPKFWTGELEPGTEEHRMAMDDAVVRGVYFPEIREGQAEYATHVAEAGSRVEQLSKESDYKVGDRVVASLKTGHPNFNHMIYQQFRNESIGTVIGHKNIAGVDHVTVKWDHGRRAWEHADDIARIKKEVGNVKESQAGYKAGGHGFTVGDKVKVAASAGYRGTWDWQKLIEKLQGQSGRIIRIFPDSDHVNVDFPGGEAIGVNAFDLIPATGSETEKIFAAKKVADEAKRQEREAKRAKAAEKAKRTMTPSKLKGLTMESSPYFFTHDTMKFFGDRMSNFGVRSAKIKDYQGNTVDVWELYRKQPVKHGLRSSHYFRKDNYKEAFEDKGERLVNDRVVASRGPVEGDIKKADIVTIDDLHKAQVQVKPYTRGGRPVIGYTARRLLSKEGTANWPTRDIKQLKSVKEVQAGYKKPKLHTSFDYEYPIDHDDFDNDEEQGQRTVGVINYKIHPGYPRSWDYPGDPPTVEDLELAWSSGPKAGQELTPEEWDKYIEKEDEHGYTNYEYIAENLINRAEERPEPPEDWDKSMTLMTIDDLYKAQVQVKPYVRGGRAVLGYSQKRKEGVKEGQTSYSQAGQADWQRRELGDFLRQNTAHFDKTKEFSDWLENTDLEEQLHWIENGTYGAGAMLAMQRTFKGLSNRMNKNARIGQVALMAFYGKPFRYWQKLSPKAQKDMNDAVTKWMAKEKDWAQEIVI